VTAAGSGEAITASAVWETAVRGRAREIAALLVQIPAGDRLRNPLAIALRAMEAILAADVPAGLALFRRALVRADAEERAYITDLAVAYAVSSGALELANTLLDAVDDAPPALVPCLLSARSVVATRRGFDDASRRLQVEALEALTFVDDALAAARTLQRLGLAALYREDYDEAQDRSLQAARAFERLGLMKGATNSYTVLYVIAGGWLGDPVLARNYASLVATLAARGGDQSMHNLGLVAQFELAAEAGDARRLGSLRARLLANPLSQQYRERFSFVIAECLSGGWAGRFETVRNALIGLQRRDTLSAAEAMLCDALLALCDVAQWDVDAARIRAHAVLHGTAHRPGHEALYDGMRRRIARVLSAVVCILIGDGARGRRALNTAVDPSGYFARAAIGAVLEVDDAAPILRGYVRFINAVNLHTAKVRPSHGLTSTELKVLNALADSNISRRDLARDLGKSEGTLIKQLTSIYGKLDVSNRTQALQKARELGINP
jgi:DNA-binding CsgD family transcriptional regulator